MKSHFEQWNETYDQVLEYLKTTPAAQLEDCQVTDEEHTLWYERKHVRYSFGQEEESKSLGELSISERVYLIPLLCKLLEKTHELQKSYSVTMQEALEELQHTLAKVQEDE